MRTVKQYCFEIWINKDYEELKLNFIGWGIKKQNDGIGNNVCHTCTISNYAEISDK